TLPSPRQPSHRKYHRGRRNLFHRERRRQEAKIPPNPAAWRQKRPGAAKAGLVDAATPAHRTERGTGRPDGRGKLDRSGFKAEPGVEPVDSRQRKSSERIAGGARRAG